MGAFISRQNAAVEEADIISNFAYKYPPRSGNYFGTHFIMGGERFDTPQPEAYLFGENTDLNFLGSRPTPFPYPPPQATEPTKTLKSLINIRKESVRFVKAPDCATKIHGDGTSNKGSSFNIEFTFDSDARCAITIYYFCVEDIGSSGITYLPRDSALTSETYHFKKGVNQFFSQNSHIFNPSLFAEDDLSYNSERDVFPIAIHCVVEEGPEDARQSHTTICVVDHHTDGTYVLRALKQKIFVDGLCYLLQEIYGIENKNVSKSITDDDTQDNGSECVICINDTRDTLILPCRHLCLCNSCADSLRYQANNCPICRAPFRALLQIRALQKNSSSTTNTISQQNQPENNDNIPPGYVAVSLIEALNGPVTYVKSQSNSETIANTEIDAVQAVEMLSRNNGKISPTDDKTKTKDKNSTDFRMSVLLNKDDNGVTKELLTKHSPLLNRAPMSRDKNPREKGGLRNQGRDCMKMVNEKNANLQEIDDDSEAEKLSPLLNSVVILPNNNPNAFPTTALHMVDVDESIDDTDTDLEDRENDLNRKNIPTSNSNNSIIKTNSNKMKRPMLTKDNNEVDVSALAGGEDSDYYTPEDPHTTILSPVYPDKLNSVDIRKSKENLSTPLALFKESATSLPDSPISNNSHISTRSSADSYSSSSSTRQLLSVPTSDTPTHTDKNDEDSMKHKNSNTINV